MSIDTTAKYTCNLCNDAWYEIGDAETALEAFTLKEPGVLIKSRTMDAPIHICDECLGYLQNDYISILKKKRTGKKKKGGKD